MNISACKVCLSYFDTLPLDSYIESSIEITNFLSWDIQFGEIEHLGTQIMRLYIKYAALHVRPCINYAAVHAGSQVAITCKSATKYENLSSD